jgi:hypothetical protein
MQALRVISFLDRLEADLRFVRRVNPDRAVDVLDGDGDIRVDIVFLDDAFFQRVDGEDGWDP